MVTIVALLLVALCLLVSLASARDDATRDEKTPDWVRRGEPIDASQLPEADYAYLAKWIDEHSEPVQDYVSGLFARHDIVIVGEFHHIREHKEFIIQLIPRLYREAGVRVIAWEFSRYTDNARLERLVTGNQYDRDAALEFARDQLGHEFNSKEHWDIIEAVWGLNKSLAPGQEKLRFVGLDMELDLAEFCMAEKTLPHDSPEFQGLLGQVLKRDKVMAEQVEKEIIQRGQKGLVFVGRCHDFTHYEFPPEVNYGREIMGNLLYKKYGDRVFQVWEGGNEFLPAIEEVMKMRGYEHVGFDLYASPFATIRSPVGWDAPGVPLSNIARGYVYLGPKAELHKNTPIEGFVTDEMFSRYKRYYEVDFERSFENAREVDEYLRAHRFPRP